jgi:RNase P subunit RPR2
MSAPLKPRKIDARQCRRCRQPVVAEDRIAFTTYKNGDTATWICAPCIYDLMALLERLHRRPGSPEIPRWAVR